MTLRAHAKINRSLSVLGVRDDGYHELKTVFQSLALHDTLDFEPADGLSLACATPGIPLDQRNLVWKAAKLVWAAAGRQGEPTGHARIAKRIPMQGGLGGGSADGAAALVGWNRLWGTGLTGQQLTVLAGRLGADVPFFLCGGTAIGSSRGDEIQPLPDPPARWVVLAFPPFGVSTPEAFRWWDEDRPAAGGLRLAASSEASLPTYSGEASLQAAPSFNDLEFPVCRRHPEIAEIKRLLEESGAEAAAMTGSGSTVFGLFASEDAARSASASVAARALVRTLLTRTASRCEARLDGADGPLE